MHVSDLFTFGKPVDASASARAFFAYVLIIWSRDGQVSANSVRTSPLNLIITTLDSTLILSI